METVLEGFRSIPGVSSAFFFNPQSGLIPRPVDSIVTEKDLLSICQTLEKFFSWGMELFSDIRQIHLNYVESTLSAIQWNESLYLILLHESGMDQTFFDRTLSKILNQSKTNRNISPGAAAAAPPSASRPFHAGQPAGRSVAEALDANAVSRIVAGLETSLNKVLGPIAAVIFSDIGQVWRDGNASPNRASIEKLIQMLCEEIGDAEKVKNFKSIVEPYLKS